MLDFAYIVGTVAFFLSMLAYVQCCVALGRRNPGDVALEERAQ